MSEMKKKDIDRKLSTELPFPDDCGVDVIEGDSDGDGLVFHHIHNLWLICNHWSLLKIGTWKIKIYKQFISKDPAADTDGWTEASNPNVPRSRSCTGSVASDGLLKALEVIVKTLKA